MQTTHSPTKTPKPETVDYYARMAVVHGVRAVIELLLRMIPEDHPLLAQVNAATSPLGRLAKAKAVIAKYDEYLKLIYAELGELAVVAHIHGWHSTRVKEGERFRADIASLKAQLSDGHADSAQGPEDTPE